MNLYMFWGIGIVVFVMYCIYRLQKMIKNLKIKINALSNEQTGLYRKLSSIGHCSLDDRECHILCIGNSITIHPPYDEVNWYSNHGMAASKPVNDYCHILEEKIKKHNANSTVTPINIAVWEKDFSIELNHLLDTACKGKNIIVIRLGENVTDVLHFRDALSCLVDYCLQYTSYIIITGQYWKDKDKEEAILYNVYKYGLTYVPLDWILECYSEECSPHIGDIIYDINGLQTPIKESFILSHPNDFGMKLIANSIYKAL